MTAETFKEEMADALKAFDKFIVCLEKTPEELIEREFFKRKRA